VSFFKIALVEWQVVSEQGDAETACKRVSDWVRGSGTFANVQQKKRPMGRTHLRIAQSVTTVACLGRHDAAGHKLIGTRIEEEKSAYMDQIPVCNSRHSA
jgi:hypothetical protein